MTLKRNFVAETVGTLLLLAAVVGSGIMGEGLSGGNVAIALLANTLATGAMLVALILMFGQISGAHFNPLVTIALAFEGQVRWKTVLPYLVAQFSERLSAWHSRMRCSVSPCSRLPSTPEPVVRKG